MNRIKARKEKRVYGEALLEARHDWLKLGWNPIADPEFKACNFVSQRDVTALNFNDALDFALGKKDLAKKSRQDYTNMLGFVKVNTKEYGLAYLNISQVTQVHILDLLQRMSTDLNWSNRRYNMYLRLYAQCFLHWKCGSLLNTTRLPKSRIRK